MNVIKLVEPDKERSADAVLTSAMGEYDSVVVLGWDHDGELVVHSTLNINAAQILFLIEQFKLKLLQGDYLA